VTAYTAVPAAIASCTAITLDSIHVPGNATLDLSKLKAGTTVTFAGITTFGFVEADYNLIQAGGTNITITAEPNAIIDGNGQAWWVCTRTTLMLLVFLGHLLTPVSFCRMAKAATVALTSRIISLLSAKRWATV